MSPILSLFARIELNEPRKGKPVAVRLTGGPLEMDRAVLALHLDRRRADRAGLQDLGRPLLTRRELHSSSQLQRPTSLVSIPNSQTPN
jgi:hypothetical protein